MKRRRADPVRVVLYVHCGTRNAVHAVRYVQCMTGRKEMALLFYYDVNFSWEK